MPEGTSPKKADANRKNALKSTGPRTNRGKAIARFNAVKHGLTAKHLSFNPGHNDAEQLFFEIISNQLTAELRPLGVVEEMLVQRIAWCQLRLRRVVVCEEAENRKRPAEIFSELLK